MIRSLFIVLILSGVTYAGHTVTATATATAVAPAGNGSVGSAPARLYRPAWSSVRVVRRVVVEVPVQAVTERVIVPRRDRLRLRLVREPRAPLVFDRTRLVGYGYGSAGN